MRRLLLLALVADRSHVCTLRSGDVAVFRGIQCIANVEATVPNVLCSRRSPDSPLFSTP